MKRTKTYFQMHISHLIVLLSAVVLCFLIAAIRTQAASFSKLVPRQQLIYRQLTDYRTQY